MLKKKLRNKSLLNVNSRGEVQTNVEVNTCKIRESDLKRMVHDIRKKMKMKKAKIFSEVWEDDCERKHSKLEGGEDGHRQTYPHRRVIGFCESGETVNRGVEILRIILLDPSFNAGGIIACHVCKIRIDVLTDRFSESTRRSKTTWRSSRESCLKRVTLATSGTLSKPQNWRRR